MRASFIELPAIALPAIALLAVSLASGQQARTTWKDYLGGPDSSHYSALNQINSKNVNQLQIAWRYETGDDTSYTFSPLVVDNIAYIAAKQGSLVAVDAATGRELWVHSFPSTGGGVGRFGGISGQRGGNYWESKDRSDRRILVSQGGFVHAIDARTGKLVDSFGDHGKLDLKTGLERGPGLASRTPGRVFENILILGSATGEGYLAPPGDVRAFDIVTGKLRWVFHTIPRPGEFGYDTWPKDAYKYMGGVDVWGEITLDEKRGIVYLPTASAKYELYGGDRLGDNLYADCLLALDARTGKLLWHYQTVHHDLWDYDPDAAPQLATVQHDGKTVDVVALASKNGFLFVFDRVTGKPLWPIEERPVPPSDVPGEIAAKTQPFPTVVPPFARQGMTVKDMYDGFMKPEEKTWWKDRLASARTGFYTPPGLIDTIQLPSVNGGALFFSTGADPTNGTVYVESKDMPSIMKLVPAGESTAANAGGLIPNRQRPAGRGGAAGMPTAAQFGRAVYEQTCQVCHGPDLKGDRGPEIDTAVAKQGAEAVRGAITKGRGTMPAFASIPGQSMNDLMAFLAKPESAPMGSAPSAATVQALARFRTEPDYPEAGPSEKMRGNAYPKSGFVITAGGLVIFAGNDSKLYALDKDTGKPIFSKELPNGSLGVPAVYELNGREYILLAVSGGNAYPAGAYVPPGGVTPPAISKSYIAFALPSTENR